MVMELANVDRETATLIDRPSTSGDRFVPPPPEIDRGLTPEQETICRRGRWLQDQVNVVFSVAHSKIRNPLDQDSQALEVSAPPVEPQEPDHEQSPQLTSVPEQDSLEKTAQPDQQYVAPQ